MVIRFFIITAFLVVSILSFGQTDQHVGDRDYWLSRYMSVSYPLKKMKAASSFFGRRKDPFTGNMSMHNGIDIPASYEEVYAMFDGSVERTGNDSRSGLFIQVRHGSYLVSFCHLSKILYSEGEQVLAGDVVAISGNSGRSTGPHLHITVRRRGDTIDPTLLFDYIKKVREESISALGYLMDFDIESEDTTLTSDVSNMSPTDFLRHHAPMAMEHQRKYGIPASVTLAQMALESEWGMSYLARMSNNYFGIKCSRAWLAAGKPYVLRDDDRPREKFCKYDSPSVSMEHHARTLMSERYKRCRQYSQTDYHRWLVSLHRCGYASDANYVKKCENIIHRYQLYKYDQQVLKG